MIKKLYLIINSFGKQLQRDNIGAYASSIAFFFLLSMFPILMIAFTILAISPLSEDVMLKILVDFTPAFLDQYIYRLFDTANQAYHAVLPVAIVLLLWSAGKGMWGMMMGLNTSYGITEKRNIIWVRILASFYSLIMLIVIIACFGMIVTGEKILHRIEGLFPDFSSVMKMLGNLRFIVVWLLLVLIFDLLFTVIPNIRLKFRLQLPGAVFAATGWAVISLGFSIYVQYSGGASLYGSLSTLILVMIWIYTCMYIFLIGANMNRYFKSVIENVLNKPKE